MRPEDTSAIRELSLFRDCEDGTFRELVQPAFLQWFPQGVQLTTEGDPADFLYVLVDGLVEMFATHDRKETTIDLVRPLGTFILAAVLLDKVFLQSARTLEKSRVLMIPATNVRDAMEQDTAFMRSIVGELAWCYRGAVKDVKNQKLRVASERLANWILFELSHDSQATMLDLRIEKRTLAARLGMTPENLSRAFNTLKPYGVAVNGGRIHVDDVADLKSFAKPNPLIDDHAS